MIGVDEEVEQEHASWESEQAWRLEGDKGKMASIGYAAVAAGFRAKQLGSNSSSGG